MGYVFGDFGAFLWLVALIFVGFVYLFLNF